MAPAGESWVLSGITPVIVVTISVHDMLALGYNPPSLITEMVYIPPLLQKHVYFKNCHNVMFISSW